MREIPGVDHERIERLFLIASAKAQIVAAEQLLREAKNNLEIADVVQLGPIALAAVRSAAELREGVFAALDHVP